MGSVAWHEKEIKKWEESMSKMSYPRHARDAIRAHRREIEEHGIQQRLSIE